MWFETNVYLFIISTVYVIVASDNVKDLECGKQFHDPDQIDTDNVTSFYEFPWLVVLGSNNRKNHLYCEGVLISSKYVLTAAHCVTKRIPDYIRLGEYNVSVEIECDKDSGNCSAPSLKYEQLIVHPKYELKFNSDNIALIKLEHDVSFTETIQPICLPSSLDEVNIGDQFDLAGWGKEYFNANRTDVKLKTKITIFDKSKCSKYKTEFGDNYVCAGATNDSNACAALGGGPLMKYNKDSAQWYVVSLQILGHRLSCGTEEYPDLYINVATYIDWINSVIKN